MFMNVWIPESPVCADGVEEYSSPRRLLNIRVPVEIGTIKVIPNITTSIEIDKMNGLSIIQSSRVIWIYFTNANLLFSWLEISLQVSFKFQAK